MTQVKREEIKKLLKNWVNGNLSEHELQSFVENIYLSSEFSYDDDFEEDQDGNEYSVINEVLGLIDMLGENLIIKEDVSVIIDFLDCKKGEFKKCYKQLNSYFQSIDYEDRKKSLRNISFYKGFL